MLSESFVASFATANTSQTPAAFRDVGICVHDFQPVATLRSTFKKSLTARHCLAFNSTHLFAAQLGKAVVNVYNRERNTQEATVPFPERIRSLALAGDQNGPAILVLGTENGRLFLWETSTGRQISTSASHLQPITSLVVDPTNNFIISGSEDANVAVWSIPALMSFSAPAQSSQTRGRVNAPVRLLSNHRAAIASIAVGHSTGRHNLAVSISQDSTAIVWEYRTGKVLRTYLLPSTPLSLTVDPADRAFYIGYEDGSIQLVEFFKPEDVQNPLYESERTTAAAQLSDSSKWAPPSSEFGAAECLTLSYDGTSILSGHRSGHIAKWDVGRKKYLSTIVNVASPVTNIIMSEPVGFAKPATQSSLTTHNIVKPRIDTAALASADTVPSAYTLQAQICSTKDDAFSAALSHRSFPDDLIAEGIAELAALREGSNNAARTSLASQPASESVPSEELQRMEDELRQLKEQISLQEAARHASVVEMSKLRERLVGLEHQNRTLYSDHQKTQAERNEILKKKRELGIEARKEWLEAEKRGGKSDAASKKTRADTEESGTMDDTDMDDE
ncbi:hypothetical protein KEM56_007790 [Ascosphaera pollenicola]|nr:hypothetical protein KEM56_007790 [Ascosphaera pollenicola]